MTDQTTEAQIQAKGLTAPRITPQRIDEVIVGDAACIQIKVVV